MRLLRAGQAALLAEVAEDGDADVLALTARLDAAAPDGLVDLVPAAATVLVRFDPAQTTAERVATAVRAAAEHADRSDGARAGEEVVLPVAYDGEDLGAVAGETGLDREEVAARHAAGRYVVAFCGFAPGFAYLEGLDDALRVPRAATPRTRVPAGAVGLAGRFTAAYPRASPGGWRLIGRTDAVLFDAGRRPAALLAPGAAVRFERRRPDEVGAPPAPPPAAGAVRARDAEAALEVVATGPLATLQDLGRPGLARTGVGASGAADRPSLRLANRLVGNPEGAAAIEATLGGLVLRARRPLLVAVTGAPAEVTVGGRPGAAGAPIRVRTGEELVLGAPAAGLRSYVAVAGGLAAPSFGGSAACDVLAALGPRPLQAGDELAVGAATGLPGTLDTGVAPVRPPAPEPVLTALRGPREDWCTPGALAALATARYEVTGDVDRVGVRLDGPPLERARADELPSEGMVPGAIQAPPDGRPVVFLADHPVTGGYPVVAVLDGASIARAAQLRPGDRVRFRLVMR